MGILYLKTMPAYGLGRYWLPGSLLSWCVLRRVDSLSFKVWPSGLQALASSNAEFCQLWAWVQGLGSQRQINEDMILCTQTHFHPAGGL